MISEILIEQVNVSDDEYKLVELLFDSGVKITKGQHILSYESSKSVFEYEADVDGYLYLNPELEIDNSYDVGFKIAVISDIELSNDEYKNNFAKESSDSDTKGYEVNFTKKAAKLFEQADIDIALFKGMEIVTEKHILKAIESKNNSSESTASFSANDIAIIGSGGHAKQVYDSLQDNKNVVGLIVSSILEESFNDLPIIGTMNDLEKLRGRKLKRIIIGFGSLNNPKKRQTLSNKLDSMGFKLESVIHKSAIIEPSATIEVGAQIFAGAIIGSRARVEKNAIVNSGAIVSHDSHIKTNAHITPGAILAGSVEIGENTIIGMGSSIYLGVKVGPNLVVNNGTHISKNLSDD